MALDVSSVPLSLTIIAGRPRHCTMVSNSRATRAPDNDVSATSARHSRVYACTAAEPPIALARQLLALNPTLPDLPARLAKLETGKGPSSDTW
jgi:hypothetical protein